MSDSTSKDLIIKEISNSPLVKKEYNHQKPLQNKTLLGKINLLKTV